MKLRTEYGFFDVVWLLLGVILVFDLSDRVPVLILPRLVFGLIAVVYIPGYFLVTALFPTKQHLNALERLVISVGLSLALIVSEAFVLDKLSLGFHLAVVVAATGIVTVILAIASFVSRSAIPASEQYVLFEHVSDLKPASGRVNTKSSIVVILAGLAVVALIMGVTNVLLPKPATLLTEFSIVDAQGSTADYPKQVVIGSSISIPFVIDNQEGSAQEYHVEVWDNNQHLATSTPINVQNGEQVQNAIPFQLKQAGDNQEVFFNLYRADGTTPYRTLHLWFDVATS